MIINSNLLNIKAYSWQNSQIKRTASKVGFGVTNKNSYHPNTTGVFDNLITHTTGFFRNQDSMETFTNAIISKFPEGARIYNYACSDGSEPYSIAMLLMEKLGGKKQAQKYFPILARDIGDEVINEAQKGLIEMDGSDNYIKDKIKFTKFENLFKPTDDGTYHQVQPMLKGCVRFKKSNLLTDAQKPSAFYSKNKKDKPCILIFRNALYNLKTHYLGYLMEDLYNNPNFPKGSIAVFSMPDDMTEIGLVVPTGKFAVLNADFEEMNMSAHEAYQAGYQIYRKL